MMKAIGLLVLVVSGVFGQAAGDLFEKAPPHIDNSLRERVRIFYQAHVDGKFRVADTVVHEGSKEAFFGSKKEQIRGFEIISLKYSNNFTKAQAVVAVDTDFLMPMVGKQKVKIPLTTLWKIENGEWWWYLPSPEEGVDTPFGTMKAGETSKEEVLTQLGSMPTPDAIRRQVVISKTEVLLSSFEASTDAVVVTNGMPGEISLEATFPETPGLKVKLDRSRVASKEQARIQFHYQPPDKSAKADVRGSLRVLPTQQLIPIRISFARAPELQQQPAKK